MAWHGIVVAGIKGLEHFNVENKEWTQAHVNAAYVIMRVLIEAGEGLVSFEYGKREGKDYVMGKLDRTKIHTVGKKALGEFLRKLHIYKSLGDIASAETFFKHYSQVDEEMLKIRTITLMHKVPRRLELQVRHRKLNNPIGKRDNGQKDWRDAVPGLRAFLRGNRQVFHRPLRRLLRRDHVLVLEGLPRLLQPSPNLLTN